MTPDASRFWSERIRQVKPYVPGEQPRGKRLIKLNTNESPVGPGPAVSAALAAFDADQLRLYPDPTCRALRQAIADFNGLEPENVFCGNGSDEVLAFIFAAFLNAGRGVAFADITYSFYPVYAAAQGLSPRIIPVGADFSLPLAELAQAPEDLVLANPNAPTGIALTRDQIRTLAAARRDRLIVLDEAYIDYGAESAVPLLAEFDHLLIVQTASKSRALAGARLGYALADPRLIEGLERQRDTVNSYPVGRLTQAIGVASFADASWFARQTAAIIETREKTAAGLARLGFTVLPSSANFLFIRHPARAGAKLAARLRQAGFLVRHFALPRIDDYLRVTIGAPEDMETLLASLERILAEPQV